MAEKQTGTSKHTKSPARDAWAFVGKTAVVVTILGTVVAGGIALIDFFKRKSADPIAFVELSSGTDIPTSKIKSLNETINKDYEEEFVSSLTPQEKSTYESSGVGLQPKLKKFLAETNKNQRSALIDALEYRQSARVAIMNTGTTVADGLTIELPFGRKGFYRSNTMAEIPFEQRINVPSIRAQGLEIFDIWVEGERIAAKEITVANLDGAIPTITAFEPQPKGFIERNIITIFIIEGIIILALTSLLQILIARYIKLTKSKELFSSQ